MKNISSVTAALGNGLGYKQLRGLARTFASKR